jgi:hypothetical protein
MFSAKKKKKKLILQIHRPIMNLGLLAVISLTLTLRAHLVHCNYYYTGIEISITGNKISCNVITITIYLFGDNT